MKQRIRTVGIIKQGDNFLFLKRAQGRAIEEPTWELLTNKIQFGEQPEEAMLRALFEFLGVHATKVTLKDVITFIAPEGASQLSNLYIVYEIILGENERLVPMERYSAYKYVNPDELAKLKVDEASLSVIDIENGRDSYEDIPYQAAANGATVYVDGSSRGNPGAAGIGYYIVGPDGQIMEHGGEFIGFASSREAEYRAMKLGIERARALGLKTVRFVGDNLMVINQLNGIYEIKNNDLLPIYKDIQGMLKDFEAVAFVHVKRSQNQHADREANLAVDRHFDEKVIK
ncbi:reverse transcriptase-like protein [Candidatus Saccharibacteria bacterium]|nr:reverse transcriptase-like protein [Candidatus Saccharibacteria bacterium]